ncbi:MAG TPA: NUDIX hydrolase [Anaerolineae bacterium]|nr:NUDIX hydrolase [Anaerolineae bacterium]
MLNTSESSPVIWQGASWRLRLDRRQLPDGSVVEKGVVDHPGSVVLVPLRPLPDDYELLMLRQFRHALDQTILELPAGTRGWQEDWLVCAQRELREETGYRAEKFTDMGEIWPAPGLSNERMHLYMALGLSPDPLTGDPDEQIEVTPMLLSDLVRMAYDGRIRDAKSIVGILKTAAFLQTSQPNL